MQLTQFNHYLNEDLDFELGKWPQIKIKNERINNNFKMCILYRKSYGSRKTKDFESKREYKSICINNNPVLGRLIVENILLLYKKDDRLGLKDEVCNRIYN